MSPEVVAGLRGALRRAGQVCCYGPGREGLVLKAFATRLHQLGIKVLIPQGQTLACMHHVMHHTNTQDSYRTTSTACAVISQPRVTKLCSSVRQP